MPLWDEKGAGQRVQETGGGRYHPSSYSLAVNLHPFLSLTKSSVSQWTKSSTYSLQETGGLLQILFQEAEQASDESERQERERQLPRL